MKVVDLELATNDVNKWLDEIRCKPHKREDHKDNIEKLIDMVQYGSLAFNEDHHFVMKLDFPIESGDEPITELVFKNRCPMPQIMQQMKNVDSGNFNEMYAAYAAVLTGKPKGVIKKLESPDFGVLRVIVGFWI